MVIEITLGASMSLLNNFNQQIYQSDLPVLFMVRKFYLSNLPVLFMVRKSLATNVVRTVKNYTYPWKVPVNLISKNFWLSTVKFIFSEKATKIWQNHPLSTYLKQCQKKKVILSNFCYLFRKPQLYFLQSEIFTDLIYRYFSWWFLNILSL